MKFTFEGKDDSFKNGYAFGRRGFPHVSKSNNEVTEFEAGVRKGYLQFKRDKLEALVTGKNLK